MGNFHDPFFSSIAPLTLVPIARASIDPSLLLRSWTSRLHAVFPSLPLRDVLDRDFGMPRHIRQSRNGPTAHSYQTFKISVTILFASSIQTANPSPLVPIW